jgi:hypothetical protein
VGKTDIQIGTNIECDKKKRLFSSLYNLYLFKGCFRLPYSTSIYFIFPVDTACLTHDGVLAFTGVVWGGTGGFGNGGPGSAFGAAFVTVFGRPVIRLLALSNIPDVFSKPFVNMRLFYHI